MNSADETDSTDSADSADSTDLVDSDFNRHIDGLVYF